jgi:hypothetical protein
MLGSHGREKKEEETNRLQAKILSPLSNLSARLSLSLGLTGGLNGSTLGLKLKQLTALLFGLGLVLDLLAFETTLGLLLETLSLVAGSSLLRVGGNLNGELHRLLQGITRALIDWLSGLHHKATEERMRIVTRDLTPKLFQVVQSQLHVPEYRSR